MAEKIEDNIVEIMESSSKEDGNTVNLEQNINVINIDVGKRSFWEKMDYEAFHEWVEKHIVHIVIGSVFGFYTIALMIMFFFLVKEKKAIDMLIEQQTLAYEKQVEVADQDEGAIDIPVEAEISTGEELNTSNIVEETDIEDAKEAEDVLVNEEEPESVTEIDLYDLIIVGNNASEKRAKAVNTVGEELKNVFFLTGGFYTETVGFYLNGEYDRFTANISCDENCNCGFKVNVYLDDGPCLETINVQRLMARTPIDIDTTGATFIKFEITGSMYTQGAILSDGVLHLADSDVEEKSQNESGNN